MRDETRQRVVIDESPEACFAIATRFEEYPLWAADIKSVAIVTHDDDGRGGVVEYRAAAMGRSTVYRLRYFYGSNPLRVSWRLVAGDLMRVLDGEYEFAPVDGRPDQCEVTYVLSVELLVPLPGFVKRRAEAKIIHTALDELKSRVETGATV